MALMKDRPLPVCQNEQCHREGGQKAVAESHATQVGVEPCHTCQQVPGHYQLNQQE